MKPLLRAFGLILITAALAACAGSNRQALPQTERAPVDTSYTPSGTPKLTLVTVVNNTTNAGAHSALLVTASEQVLFDPAGSFRHAEKPAQGDVLYAMSPRWVQAYKSAHARASHHVVTQEIDVTAEQAEIALNLVKENGAVGPAFCTNATTRVLREVPGFEDVTVTFYPRKLMEQVAARPGVRTEQYFEDDSGGVVDGIVPAAG